MRQILVLGSLNIDLVQSVPRLPTAGETLQSEGLQIFSGGKGANQASAAARMGGRVRMAGKVGRDLFGERMLSELRQAGVSVDAVEAVTQAPTGTAVIFVLPEGENVIVVSAGANGEVSEAFARSAAEKLEEGDLLLCQLEVPVPSVAAALEVGKQRGATTILDPAPAQRVDQLLSFVSILTPNQTEAELLSGSGAPVHNRTDAEHAARILQKRGAKTVIVKLGAGGCLVAAGHEIFEVAGHRVPVKDTTAAGDTFNGALAAQLAQEKTLKEAVEYANAAAALSVMKAGAAASIPSAKLVERFLAQGLEAIQN